MTVPNTVSVVRYTGDNIVVAFTYPFVLNDTSHMEVSLDGVVQGSGFTVVGVAPTVGGTVTFSVAPGSGVIVTLRRVVPYSQLIDYITGGTFPANTHELGLDLLTMSAAQNKEITDRCLKYPVTSETADAEIPDPDDTANHGRIFRMNATGVDLVEYSASDIVQPLSTKGDLLTYSTLAVRKPIGTDDYVLVPRASEADGLAYVPGLTTRGDLWTYDATEQARLAIGTTGQVLGTDGTDPVWVDHRQSQQCQLVYTSTTVITLMPHNGNVVALKTGSTWGTHVVPSAGVAYAVTTLPLVASTLYYIYLYNNAGTLTLEGSTTGYAVDADTGFTIKTGDATRLLVGMVYPVAGPLYANTATQRYVRSYYNDPGIHATSSYTADRSTASATLVELNSEIRINFLMWLGEQVWVSLNGEISHDSASQRILNSALSADGSTALTTAQLQYSGTALTYMAPILYATTAATEGLKTFYHLASITSASTLTATGTAAPGRWVMVANTNGGK
jgi:hypothetical protein